jgi:hypothetical protein
VVEEAKKAWEEAVTKARRRRRRKEREEEEENLELQAGIIFLGLLGMLCLCVYMCVCGNGWVDEYIHCGEEDHDDLSILPPAGGSLSKRGQSHTHTERETACLVLPRCSWRAEIAR